MRLRSALALGVTAAMAAPVAAAVAADVRTAAGSPAHVRQAQAQTSTYARTWRNPPGPSCGDPSSAGFPIGTRIRGGPATYHRGDGFQTWYVDLANTTARSCRNIHPVVVLIDRARSLAPAQIRLEFHDPAAGRWHPVRFEKTDEDELVGAFDDGFPGFAVPAGRTVPVKVRLAFTDDVIPGQVVANAATVQRQGDDGDWVGESNDYRFTTATGTGTETETGTGTGTGDSDSSHSSDTNPSDGTGFAQPPSSLAQTGSEHLLGLGVTAGVLLLLGGGALVVGYRRFRTGRY